MTFITILTWYTLCKWSLCKHFLAAVYANRMINRCAPRVASSCAQAQPRIVMHTVSMCIVGVVCFSMCNVRTRSLSFGQSMHGRNIFRTWLSRRTSLRAADNPQSLFRLPPNLAAAHATLVAAAARRAAPAWQHVQRLQHHDM